MMIRRWIIHIDSKFGKEKTINQQINLYNEKDNLFVAVKSSEGVSIKRVIVK